MIQPEGHEKQDLISFVREGLGCGCPDEVFLDIQIEPRPHAFTGLPVDILVRIGGRLLVAVCMASREGEVEGRLGPLFAIGKGLRDRDGFNRFRLVVASDEAEGIAPACEDRFRRLSGADDRLHLHVVRPSALPACLRGGAEEPER